MYFPKSQIKTNLYTNGGEYVISSNKSEYVGYYFQISTGKLYTGNSPGDNNQLLEPITPSSDELVNSPNNLITILSPESIDNISRSIPNLSTNLPTSQNYEEGKMVRYFTKKTNELKYKEISKQTYTLLKNKDTSIAWDLYEPEKIEWEIRGNKPITFRNNKQKITKIEQSKKWYGFSKFLKEDYIKYWKP